MMQNSEEVPQRKKRMAKHFSAEEKRRILSIFEEYSKENPMNTKTANVIHTASVEGISVSSVFKILREYQELSTFRQPKAYHRQRLILDNIDWKTKSALRRLIHSFFEQDKPLTLSELLTAVRDDEILPTLKRITLWKLIKEIGFKFSKKSTGSLLKENDKIVNWRRNYIRQVKKFREQGKKLYFLDDTCLDATHTVYDIWKNSTVTSPQQTVIQGLIKGLQEQGNGGNRLIVLHIGSEDGFLKNGLLSYETSTNEDYHKEITSELFENWFVTIIEHLERNSVIIMDTAPYRNRKTEKIPNNKWRKSDIETWLQSKSIPYEENLLRIELLEIVRKIGYESPYILDEIAKQRNITILRLPPFHLDLNPIEFIFKQIKSEVARHNKTNENESIFPLFTQAINTITIEHWKAAIERVIAEEDRLWQVDIIMENAFEKLLLNESYDNATSSDYDSE